MAKIAPPAAKAEDDEGWPSAEQPPRTVISAGKGTGLKLFWNTPDKQIVRIQTIVKM